MLGLEGPVVLLDVVVRVTLVELLGNRSLRKHNSVIRKKALAGSGCSRGASRED